MIEKKERKTKTKLKNPKTIIKVVISIGASSTLVYSTSPKPYI